MRKELPIGVEEACGAIVEIANANMLETLRIVSVEQGYDQQSLLLATVFAWIKCALASRLAAGVIADRDCLVLTAASWPPRPGC